MRSYGRSLEPPARMRPRLRPRRLLKERHQQQRNDIDDLDERVDSRPRRVLVRITHRVTRHRGLVRIRALAAEVTFLDVLLRVVPRATAGGHRDGDEDAGHDRADEEPAERADARVPTQ